MRHLKLNHVQIAKLSEIDVHNEVAIKNIQTIAPNLEVKDADRILKFLRILEAQKGLRFDCIDGQLVGVDIKGDAVMVESDNPFYGMSNGELSIDPAGVVEGELVIDSNIVALDGSQEAQGNSNNSNNSSKAIEDGGDEAQLNTIQDPRYEIKMITSLSASSTAEKALSNGAMLKLPQDANLQYVADTLRANGTSIPLSAHCNGVNKQLTILSMEGDDAEDYMVYLPATEGVASEIISVDKSNALAVDNSGQIYLIKKDPEWDFSERNGKSYDRLMDPTKGASEKDILAGLSPEEKEELQQRRRGGGGGFSLGSLSDLLPKKEAHSLAGAMFDNNPAGLPGYMQNELGRAQDALKSIRESELSPVHPDNITTMKDLHQAMENMAVSAERMKESGIDLSKDDTFKDFVSKYSDFAKDMAEASKTLKESGSDLLHQGKTIMESIDVEKLREMAKSLVSSLASVLGKK